MKKTLPFIIAAWLSSNPALPNKTENDNIISHSTEQIANIMKAEKNIDFFEAKNLAENIDIQSIPPRVKELYEKLHTIKNAKYSAYIKFSELERVAFSWDSEFQKYITSGPWKKLYKNLRKAYPILNDKLPEDIQRYKENNPDDKSSKKTLEILAQPIEISNANIQMWNKHHVLKVVSISDEVLFVVKQINNEEQDITYFDIWSVFYNRANESWAVDKVPIKIKWNTVSNIFDQNLKWLFVLGIDGNLYEVNNDMKIITSEGYYEQIKWNDALGQYALNRNTYIWFWNGEVEYSHSDYTLKTFIDTKDIVVSKLESKREQFLNVYESFSGKYTLVFESTWECFLQKGQMKSILSKHILSYTTEEFKQRIHTAEQTLEHVLDSDKQTSDRIEKKDEAFNNFLSIYCIGDSNEQWVYILNKKQWELNFLNSCKWEYWAKKPTQLKNDEATYVIIVDIQTGTELNKNTVPLQLTTWKWEQVDMLYIPSSIKYHIQQYEKNNK